MAQNSTLEIHTNFKKDQPVIGLEKVVQSISSVDSIASRLSKHVKQLQLYGYLNVELDSLVHTDSLHLAYMNPGLQIEAIKIYYSHIASSILSSKDLKPFSKEITSDHATILFSKLPDFLNSLVEMFERKGDSFVQISLTAIELQEENAFATLIIDQNFQRNIDKVIVKGYENFPRNYINHELNLKIGSTFNRDKLAYASRAIRNLPFASENKAPEVLFTQDSTIVYLYLNKKKSNQFDGIIGFASKEDENGLEFNGYLDLSINNIFNAGETISLFWKNNGEDRQRFYLEAETPFLFNLPLTPNINFELYRQDSTFNNVKANLNLLYKFPSKGSLALEFSTEDSNDLLNGSGAGINSYSNIFYGLSYHYRILSGIELFPVKFNLSLSGLLGSRKTTLEKTEQSKFFIRANYLFDFDNKNFIFIQNNSGLLNSNDFLENELFRIGGVYNLRGVNEESIFASAYTIFNLEYRFKPNASSYFYSITDYAYTENELTTINTNIFSLGLGYAFRTKAGILNLSYAIGKFDDSPFTFDNSKVHIKILSNF